MIRYGYAIRTGGDPEIATALRDGMERGTGSLRRFAPPPSQRGTAAAGTSSGAARHLPHRGRLGPRAAQGLQNVTFRRRSPEELEAMIEEARVIYGGRRYTPRWAQRLLVGYALICYGVSLLYHAQDSMMEGGRTDVW